MSGVFSRWRCGPHDCRAGFFHPEGAKISCFAKKSWVDFLPFLRFVSFGFFLSFFVGTYLDCLSQ